MQVIKRCEKIDGGLPSWERSKMMTNLLIDSGVGFIPVAGDILAAVYKSNTRNAAILEKVLKARGEENLKKHGDTNVQEKRHWFGVGSNKTTKTQTDPTVTAPTTLPTAPPTAPTHAPIHLSSDPIPPTLPPNHPTAHSSPPPLPPSHPSATLS